MYKCEMRSLYAKKIGNNGSKTRLLCNWIVLCVMFRVVLMDQPARAVAPLH